jgi:hypothetical protein
MPGTTAEPTPAGLGASVSMSSAEFTALLDLTPKQHAVLTTLVRQTTITIGCDI